MKLFIRISGIITMGMCICLILMNLLDLNIRKDEVDKISRLAMNSTQIIMQENIEDAYYGTNNARLKINSSEEYENIYKENLLKLQTTDGIYNLSFKSDPNKGILAVYINYVYTNFLGNESSINKNLINIIDVVTEQ